MPRTPFHTSAMSGDDAACRPERPEIGRVPPESGCRGFGGFLFPSWACAALSA